MTEVLFMYMPCPGLHIHGACEHCMQPVGEPSAALPACLLRRMTCISLVWHAINWVMNK
jgi:hypothetical protein